MPHRVWKHHCKESDSEVLLGVEVCPDCNYCGIYDGWHYSMFEAMGAYQQRTGLKPIGPHRGLADQLLDPLFSLCQDCNGRGVLEDRDRWRLCPGCDGAIATLVADHRAVSDALRKILEAFPNASVGSKNTDIAESGAARQEEAAADQPDEPKPEYGMFLAGQDFTAEDIAVMYRHLTGKETTAEELEEVRKLLEEDEESGEATAD
jgi:hypothetical protein